MPRKKSQTKRGNKSKNNKSRRRYITHFLSRLNIHTNSDIVNSKYINSNTLSIIGILFLFILSIGTYCKPYGILPNPMTYFMNINHHTIINNNPSNNHAHNNNKQTTNNNHNNGENTNQFCRIQSTPSPSFQRQLETQNPGYIAFEGCRVVPSTDNNPNQKPQMSNEEKDINEIMAQLQSNAPSNTFGDSILWNGVKKIKKISGKKKNKKKKKQKVSKKTVTHTDEDMDKLREMDEHNEFGIDNSNENVWLPRRERDRNSVIENSKSKVREFDSRSDDNKDEFDINDTDIDINLMGMYRRGFELQLNKMHYASDTAYEQIMEDISTNGKTQSDIYQKYHIDFIPDEKAFKLKGPHSNVINVNMNNIIGNMGNININNVGRGGGGEKKNEAFKNFYALTRMQQKYIRNDNNRMNYESDYDEEQVYESDIEEDDMSILRDIIGYTPNDILHILLNDDKLPQWLYESDTIMDMNCGIGDNLIYLLSNFTTIKGICIVGTNKIKYKYAYNNIRSAGLLDRVEIVNKDLYSPYIKSLYNVSDVIYMDFNVYGDDEYLNYFINDIMNDQHIRSAKPGRVILSYNKLLFDPNVFHPSYTLHFANGGQSMNDSVYSTALRDDVSLYMYSIPFYLSKLSNLYMQNYQIFYGYEMHPMFDGFNFDNINQPNNDTNHTEKNPNRKTNRKPMGKTMGKNNGESGKRHHECTNTYKNSKNTKKQSNNNNNNNIEYISNGNYIHFNNAIFRKISSVSSINKIENINLNSKDEETIFEIITSSLNINEITSSMNINEVESETEMKDEVSKIWNVIASQLLHQSFINSLQIIIKKDIDYENKQMIDNILNIVNQRYTNNDQKSNDIENEWEYLQYQIDNIAANNVCKLYKFILDQWQYELNIVLKEFSSLFFYQSVKDTTNSKIKSLIQKCNK